MEKILLKLASLWSRCSRGVLMIKQYVDYPWIIGVILVGLCLGYIHLRWFAAFYFHGDTSSMQILAKAILDERSILPIDFYYGNQIVFLRSSLFISLALFFGFRGYEAFILGSSLGIAFWTFILHCFLSSYFGSKSKGLLFSVLLMIPFGIWEADYVVGEQSHIANMVLSFGIMVSIYQYLINKRLFWLIVSCLCLFIMSLESPIRGILVAVPVSVVVAILGKRRDFLRAVGALMFTLVIAYVQNKHFFATHTIAANYFHILNFKSSNEIFENLLRTTGEALSSISNVNLIARRPLSKINFIVYYMGLLFVFANIIFFFVKTSKICRLFFKKIQVISHLVKDEENSLRDFISFTAVLGVFIDAIAVASLNPDSSRHYFWAVATLKFSLLVAFYEPIAKLTTRIVAGLAVTITSLLLSCWFANLVIYEGKVTAAAKARNYTEEVLKIQELSAKTGIKYIYGEDFWRMIPLNTLLDDVNAQDLALGDGEIHPNTWLSRPSWSCVKDKVLYYLKNGETDKAIEDKLKVTGGEKVYAGNGYTLWLGFPVWKPPLAENCLRLRAALR